MGMTENEHENLRPVSDDENINPEVYKVEDGHTYVQSLWQSLKEQDRCALCGSFEHFHIHDD